MPWGLPGGGGGGEMLNFRIDRRIKQIPDFILFDEIYDLFRDIPLECASLSYIFNYYKFCKLK